MLTPNQIKNHSFQYTRGGYKAGEVDDYLNEIVDSYDQMFKENGELLSKLEVLARRIEEYREDEDKIKLALITAQKAADTITTEAQNKADAMINNATTKAEELLSSAQTKADSLVLEASRNSTNTLNDSENKANEVIEGAKLVADNVINQAKQVSEDIVSDAKKEVKIAQGILDNLKAEASKFRSELLEKYKNHIEFINTIPDEVVKQVNNEEKLKKEAKELVEETVQETEILNQSIDEEITVDEDDIDDFDLTDDEDDEDETLQVADDQMTMQFSIPSDADTSDDEADKAGSKLPESLSKKVEIKFGENYSIEDDEDQYDYENDIPPEEEDDDRSFRGIFRKKK